MANRARLLSEPEGIIIYKFISYAKKPAPLYNYTKTAEHKIQFYLKKIEAIETPRVRARQQQLTPSRSNVWQFVFPNSGRFHRNIIKLQLEFHFLSRGHHPDHHLIVAGYLLNRKNYLKLVPAKTGNVAPFCQLTHKRRAAHVASTAKGPFPRHFHGGKLAGQRASGDASPLITVHW